MAGQGPRVTLGSGFQATRPADSCPASNPSQGISAAPLQNFVVEIVENLEVGKGGPSLCRDGDPLPFSISFSGVIPLQAASTHKLAEAALKVSDGIPSRGVHAVNSASGSLAAEPLKTGPAPSYAAVVRKSTAPFVKSKANCSAGDPCTPFGERSFFDAGDPSAFGQIVERDGRRVISFSAQELDELVAPFKYTLVGKFSYGFPSMKTLRLVTGNLSLKEDFSVALLEERHVIIRLRCEEDYTRLWCRQVWFMAGFGMRVFKWTPDFRPEFEAPYAPVWVKFPYLPVHLFDKKSMFTIASSLGKPLRIDGATAELSRPSTPRVCVEINLSQPLLQEVEISLDGKPLIQPVEYENIPKYCSNCKLLGHAGPDCKSVPGSFDKSGSEVRLSSSVLQQHTNSYAEVSDNLFKDAEVSVSGLKATNLDDSISFDSKGSFTFTPKCIDMLDKPVDFSKISEVISQSYDLFDDLSDPERVSVSRWKYASFMPDFFVKKKCLSVGDRTDSEPITLPKKKKVKGKTKRNTDKPK
ncbi:hypothetical protein OROMI_021135 [Orobanche minor]